MRITSLCLLLLITAIAHGQDASPLRETLLFHVSFDRSADADFARGDGRIYTAETLAREKVQADLHSDAVKLQPKEGRFGGSLEFAKKTSEVVFYRGKGNLPKAGPGMAGSFSFWMRLTPDDDLPPGYVDPLQVTDKKWNDACFFVDFTKETPRKFRLGVFSDYAFWNPQDRKWEDIAENERPMVTVDKPPFARDRWTHVGITFGGFNDEKSNSTAALYLDGKLQGELARPQKFTWNSDKLAIMLGIYYVGGLDDLAVFNRALSAEEMQQVIALREGIMPLR